MSRINVCAACNAAKNGVKSRIAWEHTCGEEPNRTTVPLRNLKGSATFPGVPDKETIDAVNTMAEWAFKNLKP